MFSLDLLAEQLRETRARIKAVTDQIAAAQKADPLAQRLATIPGGGALSSSAFAATAPDVETFTTGRDYAAWLGLTPQPHSSGGKERRTMTYRIFRTLPCEAAPFRIAERSLVWTRSQRRSRWVR